MEWQQDVMLDLMPRLGGCGVTSIVKFDDERLVEGGAPWTVILSGAGIGTEGAVREESADLRACLVRALRRLRTQSAQWSWLDAEIVALEEG
ncbi:hypothetical protein [Luteimicrobium subarcticum]|uniref:Uncharacterized protein n=1 Tax=Luteimicrobium subarcticum TaxID=620910 RepID=A0A2M8W473_9MICO|nr:hypothetical protein [Luteimicrobium subarcticum]PJI85721.1 hypothetical protein CLV34_2912 [Luteimicrobium subarcticum]